MPAVIFLLLGSSLMSDQTDKTSSNKNSLENTIVGFSYGRYELSDPRYKRIYETGREIYSLEGFRLLRSRNRHHFGLAAGIKRFNKRGHSTITHEDTLLTLSPIYLGIRYLLKVNNLIPWVELGLDRYTYTESADIKTTKGSAIGYHIQGGFYLEIPKFEFIKLTIYAKHTHAMAKEEKIEVNLGGFEYSIGLAFGFNLF